VSYRRQLTSRSLMSKNKIIAFIVFLWVFFIVYSVWDDDIYVQRPTPIVAANLFFMTLILFSSLVIGNLFFLRIFRAIPFSNLKHQIFSSGVVTVISFLIIAITLPTLLNINHQGKETAAIEVLQTIHRGEAAFYSARKRFANLDELVDADLLGKNYRENQIVSGYRFSITNLTNQTFCVHADRAKKSSGDRDFNVSEDGEVRATYSENIGTVARGEGRLLTDEVE
jgi:hypothetical protein